MMSSQQAKNQTKRGRYQGVQKGDAAQPSCHVVRTVASLKSLASDTILKGVTCKFTGAMVRRLERRFVVSRPGFNYLVF